MVIDIACGREVWTYMVQTVRQNDGVWTCGRGSGCSLTCLDQSVPAQQDFRSYRRIQKLLL